VVGVGFTALHRLMPLTLQVLFITVFTVIGEGSEGRRGGDDPFGGADGSFDCACACAACYGGCHGAAWAVTEERGGVQ
jgi:hypothetical protein